MERTALTPIISAATDRLPTKH